MNQKILHTLNHQSYEIYYNYLIQENQKLNLTAITDKEDVYLKHFYDSLMITEYVDFKEKKVLDIGAGAGFPSIPILLKYPSMDLTIIDGLKKRIDFLSRLSERLDINGHFIHGRAESLDHRQTYDIVLARAVAKLNILLEMALPLLKLDGLFIAFKSIHYQEELADAKDAISTLGGQVERVIEYELSDELKHVYLLIKKVKPTPKAYPRSYAKIKKSPL